MKVQVKLRPDAKPTFYNAKKIPFAPGSKVDNVLKQWEDEDVIQLIEKSEWVSPIVVVPKPGGEVRVCADFNCAVNPYIVTDSYSLPNSDEIFAKMEGAKYFKKLTSVMGTYILN